MRFLWNGESWGRLLGIVLVDLVLAGDNALVIALALRGLPVHLQTVGAVWGTLGAVLLRAGCAFAAGVLLPLPGLRLLAGALLVWIALRLVQPRDTSGRRVRGAATLRDAIMVIGLADAAMSFDNVLAITALAGGNAMLLIVGLVISLPLLVWGSRLLSAILTRSPWLVWAGVGVLGYVAGELALRDTLVTTWLESGLIRALGRGLPLALGAAMAGLGVWRTAVPRGPRRRRTRRGNGRTAGGDPAPSSHKSMGASPRDFDTALMLRSVAVRSGYGARRFSCWSCQGLRGSVVVDAPRMFWDDPMCVLLDAATTRCRSGASLLPRGKTSRPPCVCRRI
jgi:YjbE family integral membrane protein